MVGCLAKFANDHHAFNSPCLVMQRTWNLKRSTGDVVLEGILVEEHGVMMLDDHVEVLLQGTVGDEARPLLYENHMPWAAEVRSKQTPDQNHVRVLCSKTRFATCHWVAGWAGRTSRQARETGGTTGPELGSRLAVVEKVRSGECRACSPGRIVGCAKHPPN